MSLQEELSFDEWFDIFMDELRKLGYQGEIDKYTFESDYEDDKSPELAAKEAFKDLQ